MLRRHCCLFSVEVVCDISHENVASIQTQHRDAFTTVSEDFNHVDLTSDLIGFVQYVDCPTRENKTLDQLYTHSTLQIGRVLVLWKTSCVASVPKVARRADTSDDKPVALMLHIMKE